MNAGEGTLSVEIQFDEYSSPGLAASHLFRTNLGINAVDALEEASALVNSSIRSLQLLIDRIGNDLGSCAQVHLVLAALQSAEALVVAVSESDVIYGKPEGGPV